jgi:hypothetical protein
MTTCGFVRSLLVGVTLASAALAAAGAEPTPPAGMTAPSRATRVPAFSLATPDGATVKAADYKGRILIARFWATW